MKLISHRGNLNGKIEAAENDPCIIDKAIAAGYEAEIDIWTIKVNLYLGHDEPQYPISTNWILNRIDKLWIHCKNIEAIVWFSNEKHNYNFFWHQEDTLTLTSHNYVWVYPGKQPIQNSIAVMPELYNDDITHCIGICSDYIEQHNTQ